MLSRRTSPAAPSVARRGEHGAGAPPARVRDAGPGVTYAIGDVHGRADLLASLLDAIHERESKPGRERPNIIFLGDFVDRGPQSREVIDLVINLQAASWCSVGALKGNHEEMTLKFLAGSPIGSEWVKLGGAATLRSYGVKAPSGPSRSAEWAAAREEFANALPESHLAFLQNLALWIEKKDYLFVHAGVKPNVPMSLQSERDLLWIRGEFSRCERPIDKIVVYGHTTSPSPVMERWKIGIDTGAYGSGVLTGLRLAGAHRALLRTTHNGKVEWSEAAHA